MLMFRKLVEVGMKVSDKLDEHLLPLVCPMLWQSQYP